MELQRRVICSVGKEDLVGWLELCRIVQHISDEGPVLHLSLAHGLDKHIHVRRSRQLEVVPSGCARLQDCLTQEGKGKLAGNFHLGLARQPPGPLAPAAPTVVEAGNAAHHVLVAVITHLLQARQVKAGVLERVEGSPVLVVEVVAGIAVTHGAIELVENAACVLLKIKDCYLS